MVEALEVEMFAKAVSLLVLSTLLVSEAHAGCKPKVETDDFTGEVRSVVRSDWGGNDLAVRVESTDEGLSMLLPLARYGVVDPPIPAEAVVQVKLDSGAVVSLTTTSPVVPMKKAVGDALITFWPVRFELDDEALDQLASGRIEAVKVPLMAEQELVLDYRNDWWFGKWASFSEKALRCADKVM